MIAAEPAAKIKAPFELDDATVTVPAPAGAEFHDLEGLPEGKRHLTWTAGQDAFFMVSAGPARLHAAGVTPRWTPTPPPRSPGRARGGSLPRDQAPAAPDRGRRPPRPGDDAASCSATSCSCPGGRRTCGSATGSPETRPRRCGRCWPGCSTASRWTAAMHERDRTSSEPAAPTLAAAPPPAARPAHPRPPAQRRQPGRHRDAAAPGRRPPRRPRPAAGGRGGRGRRDVGPAARLHQQMLTSPDSGSRTRP